MSDHTISAEVDREIDELEGKGWNWYIVGGSRVIPPSLAFSMPEDGTFAEAGMSAMVRLSHLFRTDCDLRKALIEHALSVGAYYVELGNHSPVINAGRTVQ